MQLFDFLRSLFLQNPADKLSSKLKQEVVLKHQVEQTEQVLINFSRYRKDASSKNVGLTIRGVEGSGKTRFIAEFLLDYFLAVGVIEKRLLYKFNNVEFTRREPSFKRILNLTKNPTQLENAFTELEPGGIIMLDDFHANSIHLSATLHNVKTLLNTEEHAKTLVILSGAFKKLQTVRSAKFESESIFPSEFELIINTPSLNQLTQMFVDYTSQKDFTVKSTALPTLKYYFKIKQENSNISRALADKGHLNNDEVVNFSYASEFTKLLDSIKLNSVDRDIEIAQIRQSPIFLETSTLYKQLKQKNKS